MIFRSILLVLVSGSFLSAQQPAITPAAQNRLELPVVLQQKVVAGTTAVGTPVQAKLEMATLVNGTVVPKGATLTGHVEESSKKSQQNPSRLKLKFDSATWKNGSVAFTAYFTGCYYPINLVAKSESDAPSDGGFHGSIGIGTGGNPRNPPTLADDRDMPGMPPAAPRLSLPTVPSVSSHWVRMDNIEVWKHEDGSLAVTSAKKDIKLDKSTTYLLESGALSEQKAAP